jgi:peptidoglycan/LPS O-acetylase OafA/YrhL
MYPLSHALERTRNNFDLLRLLAAIAVLYGYSFLLQLPDGHSDPIRTAFGFDGATSLGVYAFFLLSGMLVTASFDRQRSATRFMTLRIARIWPPVAAGMLFIVFVLGPVFTTLPLRDYFTSNVTWANLDNLGTITRYKAWLLPGVFAQNPYPDAICQPLWALTVELRCYFIVLVTGMMGLLSSRWRIVGAVLLGVVACTLRVHFQSVDDFQIGLRDFSVKPGGFSFWPEYFFMIGMLLYGWRDYVRADGWSVGLLVMTFLAFRDTAGAQPLFYLAFVFGLLWIGTAPALHRFVPRHDYSFGILIYGFIVQQSVASIAPHLNHLSAVLISAPFIFAFAYLSWHWVEKPVLGWCRRRLARTPADTVHGSMVGDSAAG